jgi:hypothetical protein
MLAFLCSCAVSLRASRLRSVCPPCVSQRQRPATAHGALHPVSAWCHFRYTDVLPPVKPFSAAEYEKYRFGVVGQDEPLVVEVKPGKPSVAAKAEGGKGEGAKGGAATGGAVLAIGDAPTAGGGGGGAGAPAGAGVGI